MNRFNPYSTYPYFGDVINIIACMVKFGRTFLKNNIGNFCKPVINNGFFANE